MRRPDFIRLPPQDSAPCRVKGRKPSGIALISVLSVLALLMVLVLAVISMSRTEIRSSASYARITDVRTLADLPVNVVMGQIRQATSGLGETRTWASQPGMIRVFGTEAGAQGRSRLLQAYRLYSSEAMVAGATFDSSQEAATLTDWESKAALFTDLNEPVVTPLRTGTETTLRKTFPIMDVSVFDANGDGTADMVGTSDGKIDGARLLTAAPGSSATHPLPLPVRWLYVCQDGRLVAPTTGNGSEATFDSSMVTASNPITGRVAFWTDDESCKVNINTASEGTPWDVPRGTSWQDQNWAIFLPGQNEFQRFPGHPAMTCLSTVMKSFDPAFNRLEQRPGSAYTAGTGVATYDDPDYFKNLYQMLPRTNWGETGEGSRAGTTAVTSNSGLPVKSERIFASVDEFFYASNIDGNGKRLANGPTGRIDGNEIRMSRAFLTAHSRAPETNLFNRPRLSLWPLFADPNVRNTKDKLLAFAATAAGQTAAYYRAQRWTSDSSPGSSQSPDADFSLQHNQQLFAYLQTLTGKPVPGFGPETFATKYGELGRNHILLEMFDLQRWGLNSWYAERDAGGAVNFAKSYAFVPPRAYVRPSGGWVGESTAIPTKVSSVPDGSAVPPDGLKGFGRWPTVVEVSVIFMPTEMKAKNNTTLRDSFDTIEQNKAKFEGVTNIHADSGPTWTPPSGAGQNWADRTLKMRPYIILQPFTPVVGMPPYSANIRYRIEGLESWKINGTTPMFADIGLQNTVRTERANGTTDENAHMTSYTGLQAIIMDKLPREHVGSPNENTSYPFIGREIPVDPNTGTFTFPGNPGDDGSNQEITIKIYSGYGPSPGPNDPPLQTLKVRFPTVKLRTPRLYLGEWKDTPLMGLQRRIDQGSFQSEVTRPGDVMRSMVIDAAPTSPSGGDYRLIAAKSLVTADHFKPHPYYFHDADGTQGAFKYEAQSLRLASKTHTGHYGHPNITPPGYFDSIADGAQHSWQTAGWEWSGSSPNLSSTKPYGLLKGVFYWQDCQPAGPIRLNGAYNAANRPGDWDNGIGRVEDGPYINKPDEGGYDGSANKYFERGGFAEDSGKAYSPNRQIASAVAFGSLPTGVHGNGSTPVSQPWQTLLFCPNPPSRTTEALQPPTAADHYGFAAPRDHLLLDSYWMPIVEPYAISEPFSTAGKVNLNHQLLPFTYLQRATALHAALRSVRVRAMPAALAWVGNSDRTNYRDITNGVEECYKSSGHWMKFETTYNVNAAETLRAFDQRFNTQKDVFRSASEICEVFLIPQKISDRTYSTAAGGKGDRNPTYNEMTDWWNGSLNVQTDGMELTGDNTRESPYNQLFPRLTTRSNVYQVHYRVQALRKARSTAPHLWDDTKDMIAADHRGSAIIERYLDPNITQLPNFITELNRPDAALDDHYRFRVIEHKQFTP
ncbi:MAG: Verru_Chthon cassette protein A [Verrucomicrobium sp.]